jgi:hypothetical protein
MSDNATRRKFIAGGAGAAAGLFSAGTAHAAFGQDAADPHAEHAHAHEHQADVEFPRTHAGAGASAALR